MRRFLHIAPDEESTKSGGGPDVPGAGPAGGSRSQGFLAAAFGIAAGLTFMLLYGLLHLPLFKGLLPEITGTFDNIWLWFLTGFIGGTFISLVYNLLVSYRLNLFGLERNVD